MSQIVRKSRKSWYRRLWRWIWKWILHIFTLQFLSRSSPSFPKPRGLSDIFCCFSRGCKFSDLCLCFNFDIVNDNICPCFPKSWAHWCPCFPKHWCRKRKRKRNKRECRDDRGRDDRDKSRGKKSLRARWILLSGFVFLVLGFWAYHQLQKRNELLEMQGTRQFESGSKNAKKSKKRSKRHDSRPNLRRSQTHLRGSDSVHGDSEYEKTSDYKRFMAKVHDTDQPRDKKTGEPIAVMDKKVRERPKELDDSIESAMEGDREKIPEYRHNPKFPKLTAANLRKHIPEAEYKGDLFRDYLKGELKGERKPDGRNPGGVSPERRNNARIFLAQDMAPPRDLELEEADWSIVKNEMKLKEEKKVEKKKRREERAAIRREWMRKATKPVSESESTDTPTKKSESKEKEEEEEPVFFATFTSPQVNIQINLPTDGDKAQEGSKNKSTEAMEKLYMI